MHVQCIVDEDYYAIEKPVQVVHKTAIEGRENLTDLVAGKEQHESSQGNGLPGAILHTLRQRYEQN